MEGKERQQYHTLSHISTILKLLLEDDNSCDLSPYSRDLSSQRWHKNSPWRRNFKKRLRLSKRAVASCTPVRAWQLLLRKLKWVYTKVLQINSRAARLTFSSILFISLLSTSCRSSVCFLWLTLSEMLKFRNSLDGSVCSEYTTKRTGS